MHKIQKCHQIKMDDRIYDGRSRLASSRHLHIAVRWALGVDVKSTENLNRQTKIGKSSGEG